LLKDNDIVCISSIDWDFIWQGHQDIMSIFAKNGNRVLFIENTGIRTPTFNDMPRLKKRFINWFKSVKGFREEMKNLYVYSPVVLPFPYSKIARWINRSLFLGPLKRWMKVMGFHNPIIWTFLPTGTALDIINNIDRKLLVYCCIADFYKLVDNPEKIKKTEDELIRKSDLIFVQGEVLKEKCIRLNDNISIFPFGVNMEVFDNFEHSLDEVPEDIKNIKSPIIGYIGGIHRHIDFKLIRFIAQAHPEWAIVLIGPIQTDISQIAELNNIFLLGKKDYADLPKYIMEFNIGIIPYQINEYTATVFPTKLNEYHALGKPTVSTGLPEIILFNAKNDNLTLVGKTYEEFTDCISKAFNNLSKELVNKRIASARRNSWSVMIERMSGLIENALERKSMSPNNWKESFLGFYRASRRKMFRLGVTFLTIYLLLFYTPFIWFIASPLKISQVPKKADCIVVFAGGVGESGKAGQGYEERVEYAVELYIKKYADYIIFSSGYMYVFKEPLVMRALAISLGVPEYAIILEDKAKNTYENVRFSKDILGKNGWSKILLISSPYHMRRSSLVFNKIAKNIDVTYTPIPNSLFYSHPDKYMQGKIIWKRVNLKQIRGILNEYLGILYYWWEKWI